MARDSLSVRKDIGSRIARERIKKDWSQQVLANQANTSRQTIHEVESGKRDIKTEHLVRIAQALEIPLSALQPEELDPYSEIPRDLIPIVQKLKKMPPDQRHDILKVLDGVINSMTK